MCHVLCAAIQVRPPPSQDASENTVVGILPLPDCKSCIVSSVGEIRKYTDTDGDGVPDFFYAYTPLPFDSSGVWGNKVLGVGYGGRLLLYGKKGANYATVPDPVSEPTQYRAWALNSGISWARLAGNLAAGSGVTVKLDRKADSWEKGDSVVITGTDYLPRHYDRRTIASAARRPDSVKVTAPYFSWSTKPCSASLRIDSEAVLSDTPIFSASILVLTCCGASSGDHSWAFQMTLR